MGCRRLFIAALLVFLMMLPGCEVIADIFVAGVIIGIIVVILIIALIVWGVKKLKDRDY